MIDSAIMSSRNEILKAVRRHLLEAVDLPDLEQSWIEYPNPEAQFAEVLSSVGGRCITAAIARGGPCGARKNPGVCGGEKNRLGGFRNRFRERGP